MKENERNFCIPLAGGLNYVKTIVELYKNKIYEFYGSDGQYPSAIYAKKISNDEFEDIVSYLHDNDIKFNYTMNSMQTESYFKENVYEKIFHSLEKMKVKYLTVFDPLIAALAKKNTNLKICVSTLMNVKSEIQIRRLLDLGFDRIILSEDCLKTIPLLKYLRRVTPEDVKLEILINNWCKMGCVTKTTHYNIHTCDLAILKIDGRGCRMTFKDYLMSSWIRPKDIPRYQEIGIDLFKFSGRNRPEKNMLDFFDKFFNNNIKEYFHESEERYDDFFDFLFEKGCNERCLDCNMCEYFAKKIYFEEE